MTGGGVSVLHGPAFVLFGMALAGAGRWAPGGSVSTAGPLVECGRFETDVLHPLKSASQISVAPMMACIYRVGSLYE